MTDTRDILMPMLSPTMDTGTLAKWLVAEGDRVNAGDVIAEIETDKATMEVEANEDGTIASILVPAQTEGVKVNTPIARMRVGDDAGSPSIHSEAEAVGHEGVPSEHSASPEHAVRHLPHVTLADIPRRGAQPRADVGMNPDAAGLAQPQPQPQAQVGALEMVTQTMREALRDAMAEEMRRDGDVFLIGEEVGLYEGAYKVSVGLLEEFGPRRIIDTPITEQAFAGIGVGAAFSGLKPIVEFMTWNFAMQAIDQIVNSAAKSHYMSGGQIAVPIVFRGVNGAGGRLAAQHSQCYSAWYAHVPGLKVVVPSNPSDAKGLLKASIRDRGPVLVLENELLYGVTGDVPKGDDHVVEIGRACVSRAGHDVTIVSYGRGVVHALDAAATLAEEGIEAEVIDLRSLRPLDMDTVIASVRRTHRLVSVEESWPVCSVGSEICARVAIEAFDDLDAPPEKVSGADVPMPYAANLEALALPNAEAVARAVRRACQGAL
ncbi:MAG TPA: pyruvate dehydrogenase complex E1 component subunit beta [Hyphomicrobiaceae bacterium]|nr:pyruvate dehydrogenase complex E1 component subunit beta [Hyphomicrobiaceae bacterium]